jgi:hypothetical protein
VNDSERRKLEAFVRSRDFGAARASDFAAGSLGRQTLDGLEAIIAEIANLAASETSGRGAARQGTTTRAQARDALIADLEALSRTARVLSAEVPGIENKFRLPRDGNDQSLLSAARAAANDALPLKAQFIAHEMPADFLEDLNEDIADMEAAISSQSSGVGDHVAAGAAIDDAFARGMVLLRRLDAIMQNKYANNPAVLAEWFSASHIERAPKRASPSPVPPPPPPPLPPTT